MVGLLMLSFIIFWGGVPGQDGIQGFRYWRDPGAIKPYILDGSTGRFVAFLACFINSAFPFTFTPELMVATCGEMQNPRVNLPKASKRYFYRLIIFYIGGVFAIGIICPHNAPQLVDGGAGAKTSPWVIGVQNVGISVLPHIINAVIITSAWSSGNSFLYVASRSLYSLALNGNAPAILRKCNRWGVPYM
jgi:yeast amino acid transporter